MAKVDHSKDHVEHPATFNGETGGYEHPESLSDHMGQDMQAMKGWMADKASKAARVVKNLTGEGEREDLFQK